MRIIDSFQFDCPVCFARLYAGAEQRGSAVTCHTCDVEVPVPDFRTGLFDAPRRPPGRQYTCHCPHCNATVSVPGPDSGRVRCELCGSSFAAPPPAWEHWRRPVAKIFTDEDQRSSLHHLMLSTDRIWFHDDDLTASERRRFEFYCGACGHLQRARVWEIAAQQNCRACDALMIVPAPHPSDRQSGESRAAAHPVARPAGVGHRAPGARQHPAGPSRPDLLYCPQCGSAVRDGDRSRRNLSHCDTCDLWF